MGGGVIILRLLKRFDVWVSLIAGLLVLAAVLLGAASRPGTGEDGGNPEEVDYSTFNPGENGLKGLYLLLERQGVPVERWRHSLRQIDPAITHLVIWQPSSLSDEEWESLAQWVKEGGTLVFSPAPGEQIDPRLTGGVQTLMAEYSGDERSALRPTSVTPPVYGVRRLEGDEGLRFGGLPAGSQVVTLASDGWDPVMLGWPLEAGYVYAVAERSLLANQSLLAADNLILAVNLTNPGPDGLVAFDEFHHAAGIAEAWWQTLRPQLRWSMLQVALAILVVLLLAGVRLGRPVALAEGVSRNAAEFAHGLARLMQASGGDGWVLQRIRRAFVRDLARYLGASPQSSPAEVARLWQIHTGEPSGPLAALLERAGSEEPGRTHLVEVVQQMAAYRRRMTPHLKEGDSATRELDGTNHQSA